MGTRLANLLTAAAGRRASCREGRHQGPAPQQAGGSIAPETPGTTMPAPAEPQLTGSASQNERPLNAA